MRSKAAVASALVECSRLATSYATVVEPHEGERDEE